MKSKNLLSHWYSFSSGLPKIAFFFPLWLLFRCYSVYLCCFQVGIFTPKWQRCYWSLVTVSRKAPEFRLLGSTLFDVNLDSHRALMSFTVCALEATEQHMTKTPPESTKCCTWKHFPQIITTNYRQQLHIGIKQTWVRKHDLPLAEKRITLSMYNWTAMFLVLVCFILLTTVTAQNTTKACTCTSPWPFQLTF